MKLPIYLDYNATTPVDERALAKMLPFFTRHYGNPSSQSHAFGWAASEVVEEARQAVAQCLDARTSEIIFTGGATEGINIAIKGMVHRLSHKGRHIVTATTEHSATLAVCRSLQRQGYKVTYLPVASDGTLDLETLEQALTEETILVTLMWANNETGVLHPIQDIADCVRQRGILFMTDATQAVGKVPVSVDNVDILVCSGHKAYAPKGVGALFLRSCNPRVRLAPILEGGGHERGLRGGTLNVPGIVGMGEALSLVHTEMAQDATRLQGLRDRLETALLSQLSGVRINGQAMPRLPQTTSATFEDVSAEDLFLSLRSLACSAGSACGSGSAKPSHVLTAMGFSAEEAARTLRISLGRPTTATEIEVAIDGIVTAVQQLQTQYSCV